MSWLCGWGRQAPSPKVGLVQPQMLAIGRPMAAPRCMVTVSPVTTAAAFWNTPTVSERVQSPARFTACGHSAASPRARDLSADPPNKRRAQPRCWVHCRTARTTSSDRCLPGWDEPKQSATWSLGKRSSICGDKPWVFRLPQASGPQSSFAGGAMPNGARTSKHLSTKEGTGSLRHPRMCIHLATLALSTLSTRLSICPAKERDLTD